MKKVKFDFVVPSYILRGQNYFKTHGFIKEKNKDVLTSFTIAMMTVGAAVGSYTFAKDQAVKEINEPHYSSEMLPMAIFGGIFGALGGIVWPVGIPILVSYKLACSYYNKLKLLQNKH